MHEYAIVQALVTELIDQLAAAKVNKVEETHWRRGSAFSEDALLQSYEALTKGTALEHAEIVIHTVDLNFVCSCGHQQVINSDNLIGHMFVCPKCDAVREIDEAHDLELIRVVYDT